MKKNISFHGGKKIAIVLAAVGLLAAGCSGSSATSMNSGSPATGAEQGSPAAPTMAANTQPTAQVQAQVNSEVGNPSDAVNLLVSQSTNEQSSVGTSDDSDLTGSDSSSLNSFTGVSNGY